MSDTRYYGADGKLKWGYPIDVGHLILQLQTLDASMKVSAVTHIEIGGRTHARAFGLSISRERWDEGGWLNYLLPGPESLAIWASTRDEGLEGLSSLEQQVESLRARLELQSTIHAWANATFGECSEELAIHRLDQELMEFFEKPRKETCDVVILLMRYAAIAGFDALESAAQKMEVNKARKWVTSGNGVGQHEGSEAHPGLYESYQKVLAERDTLLADPDKERLDWLDQEQQREQEYIDGKREWEGPALFRKHAPITRTTIDAARKPVSQEPK